MVSWRLLLSSWAISLCALDLPTRIASRYEQMIDYRVEVETTVQSDTGEEQPTRIRYLLAASKPRQMYTDEKVITPWSYRVVLGSDGRTSWAYSAKSNSYVVNAETQSALRDQHFRLLR